MTVEELRIGNLVDIGKEVNELELVDFVDMYENDTLKHFDPIPLNKDWLVKLGFEELEPFDSNKDGGYHEDRWMHNETKLTLWFYLGNFDACSIDGEGEWINVSHVHQLQNLYFALTGEELTLKTVL